MKKTRRNKKGFTLIELIVVIAILGILAAILVPTISGFINDANERTDVANAKLLYNAGMMWIAKDGGDLTTANAPGELDIYVNPWPIPKAGASGATFTVSVTGSSVVVMRGTETFNPSTGLFS